MKAFEIMNELFAAAPGDYSVTCDTLKAGSPEKEVGKIAVSMFATPEIVRRAAEWGADLLIVHEPTYYNHMDVHSDEALECEKRALIEKSGLTIYRNHDHAHRTQPDTIVAGEMKYMKLDARIDEIDGFDCVRLTLNQPMTPRAGGAYRAGNRHCAHPRLRRGRCALHEGDGNVWHAGRRFRGAEERGQRDCHDRRGLRVDAGRICARRGAAGA